MYGSRKGSRSGEIPSFTDFTVITSKDLPQSHRATHAIVFLRTQDSDRFKAFCPMSDPGGTDMADTSNNSQPDSGQFW